MGFMDLFTQPGSPLAMLTAASMPQPGTAAYYNAMATGQGMPDSMPQGQGPIGGGANLVTSPGLGPNVPGPNPLNDLLSNQNNYAGYGRGYSFTPDQAASTPAAAVQTSAAVPSTSSLSDLINSLLGSGPNMKDYFDATPYNDAMTKLTSQKADATKGITDAYAKALADLTAAQAHSKQDQAQYAAADAARGQQANDSRNSFLASIGVGAPQGSALGAILNGQAASMAQNQSNQAETTARLSQAQNLGFDHAQTDAAFGQQGSLNALNAASAASQGRVVQQEALDHTSALKDFAAAMAARQTQAGSLLNNAQSFLDKNTTSLNSRDAVQNQLAQMQQSGQGDVPAAFNSIVYGGDPDGKGGYTVGAKNQAEAIQRLQAARGTLQQHGIDANTLQSLIGGYYSNTTTKQAPPDIQSSLEAYLKALTGRQ